MGIRRKRFPEFGVTLEIFSGVITAELLLERLGSLREGDLARWIGYLDATVDLSQVDLAAIPDLKRANAARLRELKVEKGLVAIVCALGANNQAVDFWLRYVQADVDHPTSLALFPSLKTACDWLDLPEAGCRALTVAAEKPEGREADAVPEHGPSERQI